MNRCKVIGSFIFRKAQSAMIYASLFAMIIAGLVMASVYLRKSLQGKFKESADIFGGGAQYEPGVTTVTKDSVVTQGGTAGGSTAGGSSWI